jgi:CRP/FNR family transcriptional regulator, cyclic AMP receptor protein
VAALDWTAHVDFLAQLGEADRAIFERGAQRIAFPAGVVTEYPVDPPVADVLQSGVLRAFQVSDQGRGSTIAYVTAGTFVGSLPAVGQRPTVFLQPLVDSTVLRLDAARFRELYETSGDFTRALAIHAGTILGRVVRTLTVRTLGGVKERIAFDLLERASAEQLVSGDIAVDVTHEALADSVGSVREVVSRVLSELRDRGIVSTRPGRIHLDDPGRLIEIVQGLVG